MSSADTDASGPAGRRGRPAGDDLYDKLRTAIINGQMPPSSRIVEEEISHRYSVSRTPVRQALHRLRLDGLIRESFRALVVSEFTAEELASFCVVRDDLEALAARLAAGGRTDLDLLAMDEVLQRFVAEIGGELAGIVQLNHDFHNIVWDGARNAFLHRQLGLVRDLIERFDSTTLATEERQRQALGEHRAIFEALQARDEDAAYAATHDHFRRATALRLLSKRAGTSPGLRPEASDASPRR